MKQKQNEADARRLPPYSARAVLPANKSAPLLPDERTGRFSDSLHGMGLRPSSLHLFLLLGIITVAHNGNGGHFIFQLLPGFG